MTTGILSLGHPVCAVLKRCRGRPIHEPEPAPGHYRATRKHIVLDQREAEQVSPFDRLIKSRLSPTFLAVGLALLSTPFVATALVGASISPCSACSADGAQPISLASAVAIAIVAVGAAGFVGGAVGGWFVRRSPLRGLFVAVAVAWPVAVTTLPIVPTLRGETYGTGYVCIDTCSAQILSGQPLSGLTAYAQSVFFGAIFILPPALAIGFAIAAWVARRRDHARLTAALGLAACGSINLWSVTDAGLPFLCLVVGALIWVSPYWVRWYRERPQVAMLISPPRATSIP